MASVGCPEENGFVERWMRTLKEDHVSMSEYDDFRDCQSQIGEFIEEVYQRKRVHSSLGYLPPAVFEERWWAAKSQRGSESDRHDLLANLSKPLPLAGDRVTIPQA
jgi:transposase InsO family protein